MNAVKIEEYADVTGFYAGKDFDVSEGDALYEFIKKYHQDGGGYLDTYKAFDHDHQNEATPGDRRFYDILCKYVDDRKNDRNADPELMSLLGFLDDQPDDFILNPKYIVDEDGNKVPDQKWHLLISWYARKILKKSKERFYDDTEDIEKYPISHYARCKTDVPFYCPELWLWIAEKAADGKYLTTDDLIRYYESAIAERKGSGDKAWKTECWEKVKAVVADPKA